MDANAEFIRASDKPALLALSSPEWQEAARAALTELGYKVYQAAAHGDFITSFSQVAYQVVILEDLFAAASVAENKSLQFVQETQMSLRRHATIILVGDAFTSFNPMQAYQWGAQLVVNRSELPLLAQFVQKAVADNDLFFHPYREAQRRQATGPAR